MPSQFSPFGRDKTVIHSFIHSPRRLWSRAQRSLGCRRVPSGSRGRPALPSPHRESGENLPSPVPWPPKTPGPSGREGSLHKATTDASARAWRPGKALGDRPVSTCRAPGLAREGHTPRSRRAAIRGCAHSHRYSYTCLYRWKGCRAPRTRISVGPVRARQAGATRRGEGRPRWGGNIRVQTRWADKLEPVAGGRARKGFLQRAG